MNQSHFLGHIGQRPEGCHHRPRRCLLKGCERPYWPRHPRCHFCSEACRQAAQRWRRWRASQQYRASEQGRERRRQQSRRYRQRCRERDIASAGAAAPREGQRAASAPEDFGGRPCARPGCYELFCVRHEASRQRFCSLVCRLALRRVLDREAHYQARRRQWRRRLGRQRPRPPDTS